MIPRPVIQKYIKPIFVLLGRSVGIAAVIRIFLLCNWKEMAQVLDWKSVLIIPAALAIYGVKLLLDALRSERLARALDVNIPFERLLKFNIQSTTFDFALPVPQAEEVYRFGRFIDYTSKKTAVILSICVKSTGLVATLISLAMTVIFASLKLKPIFKVNHTFWIYFILADLVLAICLVTFRYLRKKKELGFTGKYIEGAELLYQSFHHHKYRLLEGVCLAFSSQVVYAVCIYLICVFNGADVLFFKVFLIIPLLYFGALVPLSTAGLGIKETIIAWCLEQYGVPSAIAWNIALVHLALMLLYLLLGALLILLERKTKPVAAPET